MGVIGVNFNSAASTGIRMLGRHRAAMNTSMEKLATGQRINRAADDPAGSLAAAALKGERSGVLNKLAGIKRENAYINGCDGMLAETSGMLLELKSHIITAANTTGLTAQERNDKQIEVNAIVDAIVVQDASAQYGTSIAFQTIKNPIPSGDSDELLSINALRTGGKLNLIDGDLEKAQQFVESLFESNTTARAELGARQKALDSEERELSNKDINLAAAISQIEDTDYAKESSELIRTKILTESATAAIQTAKDLQAETILALITNQTVEEIRENEELAKA